MARWRLTQPHYLNVPDCFWEEKETDRMTQKQKRVNHPVPMHLDPNNEADWNYKNGAYFDGFQQKWEDGGIIVCHEGKGQPRDIVFFGNPTPDMLPLDDEAKEISAKFDWKDPINEFDAGLSYSEKMLIDLQAQVANALTGGGAGAPNAEIIAMQKQMMEMMAQNAQVIAMLAQVLTGKSETRRA